MVVDGKSWPYLNVEPRRYRFRILNGCNARVLELWSENKTTKNAGPAIYQIGSDGGLLDKPAPLSVPVKRNAGPGGLAVVTNPRLVLAPGERADVIVDFKGYEGQSLVLNNTAKAPFPFGSPPDPNHEGDVMQFRVGSTVTGGPDMTYNPASGAPLRGGANQMPAIINIKNATPLVKRQLTLVEVMGPGGPVDVLVNRFVT
jgi:FtsP/CotA-like multicopper oxidase with cupredoxin domain